MFRRLTAGIVAATLVFTTALPTPAAAMSDKDRQLLTLLLGAVAVGVIVNESKKKKRESQAPVVTRRDNYRYDRRDRGWSRDDRWRFRSLPGECVFSVRGLRGPRDVVSANCLKEFGVRRDLPAECRFDIEAGWGRRAVYGTRCLRRNGYQIAAAR